VQALNNAGSSLASLLLIAAKRTAAPEIEPMKGKH